MTTAVAVLRPEPGNARTAARVESRGLVAVRLPLFRVAPLAWITPDPARYDAILATSANAFRHGGEGLARLRALPVRAVGDATAAAARAAGFAVTAIGERDAASVAAGASGRLLHLAGRDHHAVAGIDRVLVYAADPLPVTDAAIARLAGTIALLHSARAARRFGALVLPAARTRIAIAALSPSVAMAAGDGWASVAVAELPRDDTLVAVAARLAATRDD